jgi:predicted phosphodiesterase
MTPPTFAPPISLRRIESVLRALTLVLFLASALGCDAGPSAREHPNIVVDAVELDKFEPGTLALPNTLTSIKFAVIGDSGRWSQEQRELAAQMARFREKYPFEFVLMLGDNIYEGPATREDYLRKFEEPFAPLLDAGVDFYAALGNHDDPKQVNYAGFNMKGERYYSFAPPEDVLAKVANRVEFFALDTTTPDRTQMQWLEERLNASKATWKICFFHHPLYTTGRYQTVSYLYRRILESLLVRHGVDVVFSGHEHIYQRSRIQQGIQYVVSGGAGSVRLGDGAVSPLIARNYAEDLHFLLVEIDGDELHFQAISRTGVTVDAGTLSKDDAAEDADEEALTPKGTAVPEQSHPAAP